jgi:heme exporter protein CcmD
MMDELLDMGGYGRWVWSAFGLAAVVLVYNVIAARRRHRRTVARLTLDAARKERGIRS